MFLGIIEGRYSRDYHKMLELTCLFKFLFIYVQFKNHRSYNLNHCIVISLFNVFCKAFSENAVRNHKSNNCRMFSWKPGRRKVGNWEGNVLQNGNWKSHVTAVRSVESGFPHFPCPGSPERWHIVPSLTGMATGAIPALRTFSPLEN